MRNGVKDDVVKCHSTGVNVVIVTGDNIITATAITKDCNNLGNDVNLENLDPRLMCCSCNLDWDWMKALLNKMINYPVMSLDGGRRGISKTEADTLCNISIQKIKF